MNIPTKNPGNSISSISTISATKSSSHKPSLGSKKIDMGAAANFGKISQNNNNMSSIHSPTHRDKPFSNDTTNDLITYTNISNNNNHEINNPVQNHSNNPSLNSNNNHLKNIDDLFKTCSTRKTNSAGEIADDDFNPRAAESSSNDFGDFSSAFGVGNKVENISALGDNGLISGGVAVADNFADFSAFQSGKNVNNQMNQSGLSDTGDLFSNTNTILDESIMTKSKTNVTAAAAAITTTDLLAGLGDLSIYQNMPMGEFVKYFFYLKAF